MNVLSEQYDVLTQILKYKNPFEIRDFLLSSKEYHKVYNDPSFWRYMIKEVYNINYVGNTPRTEFFRLYVKDNYTLDTMARDLPSKYHWIFYIIYFTGINFTEGNFEVLTPDRVLQEEPLDKDTSEHFDHRFIQSTIKGMGVDIESTIRRYATEGRTSILAHSKGGYLFLGDINDISINTLFSIHDPLDFPLWILQEDAENRGSNVTDRTIAEFAFTPDDLDYLGLKGYDSLWNNRENWYPNQILDFVHLKLDEGKTQRVKEILEELAFIIDNAK